MIIDYNIDIKIMELVRIEIRARINTTTRFWDPILRRYKIPPSFPVIVPLSFVLSHISPNFYDKILIITKKRQSDMLIEKCPKGIFI
jgi:hypothetical protein